MEAVLKVGGSLQAYPAVLRDLCRILKRASKHHRLLVVPGGGDFAEFVREAQAKHKFSDRAAHLMAILGMEAYGLMLHELIEGSVITDILENPKPGKCVIFQPYKALKRSKEVKASWQMTSDSIAAWVASKIGCKKLVLIKATNGISSGGELRGLLSTRELKEMKQSVVDQGLAGILEKAGITCWVVNGRYPRRVEKVLMSERTICTIISLGV